MTGHYCKCGSYYARTLNILRKHARTCEQADATLRAADDRARLDRVSYAKWINDQAHEDHLDQP